MNKRNITIIVGILAFIIIVGGISYSYFVYNKDVGTVTLNAGEISIDFSDSNGNKTLTNVIPMSDVDGKNISDYFDFTVNSTVDTDRIYYEVYLLPKSGNTLDTSYLKVYLTDQNNVEIKGVRYYSNLSNSEKENGKVIYRGIAELNNNQTTKNESKDFRLRMWLDEEYSEQASKTFEFDIYLYAKNVADDFIIPEGSNLIRNAVLTRQVDTSVSCSNMTYTEDGITYLSGSKECINFNYVWYSGKLWRVTAIYPDGAMKLVTENHMTAISFNEAENSKYYTDSNTKSWVYQWLNEDFLDTLDGYQNIFDFGKIWNYAQTETGTASLPLVDGYYVSVTNSPVGLMNSYEYYNSYRNISSPSNGYLNNNLHMWLLNAYNSTSVWYYSTYGGSINKVDANAASYGVRPTIYLKPEIDFIGGTGFRDNPYTLEIPKGVGQTNDLLNSRISGEFIKFNGDQDETLYRIVSFDGEGNNAKTKIVTYKYAGNGERKVMANANATGGSSIYGASWTTTGSNTWYMYLNGNDGNTGGPWYTNMSILNDQNEDIKDDIFVTGDFYFGWVRNYEGVKSYKLSICPNDTLPVSQCNKSSMDKRTFLVGLFRYGEMFAAQQIIEGQSVYDMYTLTPAGDPTFWHIHRDGAATSRNPAGDAIAANALLFVRPNIKILSGSGTESDPYVVGL